MTKPTMAKPTMSELRAANSIFFNKSAQRFHKTKQYKIMPNGANWQLLTINVCLHSDNTTSDNKAYYIIDQNTLQLKILGRG